MPRKVFIFATVLIWLLAIALAVTIDRPIALWMRDSGWTHWLIAHHALQEIWKSPGEYGFTIVVIVIALFVSPKEAMGRPHSHGSGFQFNWRASVFILLASAISGLNGLIKWIVGRTRPFKLPRFDQSGKPLAKPFVLQPFRDGWHGLFNGKNLCFPSGHAALAFATAAALAILWPRCRWTAYMIATLVAVERVIETAHWASDTVAAAALGIGGVKLLHWALTRFVPDVPRHVSADNEATAA